MKRFFSSKLLLATLLCCLTSTFSAASDLSLDPLGEDLQLASLHQSNPTNTALSEPGKSNGFDISITEMDVWERIRRGFGIPNLKSRRVNKQMKRYRSQQNYVKRMMHRSSRYLFHIVQELEIRGMPTELALLPFIESAYNPNAKSSAKAAGIWQFIPATGRHFKLMQSTLKDDRQSVLKSTDAALNYLQRLHNQFGDWHLALAAYNWGQGSLRRAIRKNKARGIPIRFNSLVRHMPAETRNYLPKFQAIKNIVNDPKKYGITLPDIENQPYFASIRNTQDIDVKVAAQLAELPTDEFLALNPQFGPCLITGGEQTRLLLPKENIGKFKENLADWDKALSSWTTYEVTEDREKIKTIAQKYGIAPVVIRKANRIPPKMLLIEGSVILVPKRNPSVETENIASEIINSAFITMEHEVPVKKRIHIKIRRNDCLWSIAKRYKVRVSQIKRWNKLSSNKIIPGKKLKLYVLQRRARL